jgi:hypothetical protein
VQIPKIAKKFAIECFFRLRLGRFLRLRSIFCNVYAKICNVRCDTAISAGSKDFKL